MKLSNIKANPSNPRIIKDDRFQKLVKSISEFPKMMELRPMVINSDNVVLGGNMRLKALQELKYKEIPDNWVKRADELTEDEQKRFIIADNVGFGEHDWGVLKAEWDTEELSEWGLDVPDMDKKENDVEDLFNIELPFYKASEIMPNVYELANTEKADNLLSKIDSANINDELKKILKFRASFFTDFNFQNIADYYHHSNNETKELFEALGMVVLAPKEALERGFIDISENIMEL